MVGRLVRWLLALPGRYVDFWSEREAPDSLALLRITFSLALLANLVEQLAAGVVLELYASPLSGGIFQARPDAPLSLFRIFPGLSATPAVVWSLFVGQFLAGLLLLAGCFTRLAALLCFLIQVTLYDQMPLFVFGGDNVFRVFLFLMVLAPGGAAWSIDALWRGRADVPRWPRRLFIFQLTVVYVATGVMKLGSSWTFMDGWSAVYLSLNLPGIARWQGDWAAWVYPLTQVGTFVTRWWEMTFFLVPLNLFLRRRQGEQAPKRGRLRRLLARRDLRVPYIAVGVVVHVSLTVLFDLGLFSVAMLSLYPCLLRPEESRRLLTWFATRFGCTRGEPGT
jgi:hypothetical protein